jgi:uncharacterized protein
MTMKPYAVDLADLESDEFSLEGTFPPGDIDFSRDGLLQLGDLNWSATIEQKGSGVRFVGRLKAEVGLSCVRCVEPVNETIDPQFELFFELHEKDLFENNDEVELEEADTSTAFIVGSELFVDEVMHEQVLLAIPMKPLCDAECKGLCSTCGANLNENSCGCPVPVINPAFEPLLEFKKRLEDQGDSAG